MARVTDAPFTVLPLVSLAVTTGWVVKAAPSPTEPAGEVLNESWWPHRP